MNRVIVDPLNDSKWSELIARTPTDVFHSPSWLQALANTYGFEPQAVLLVDDKEQPIAGVAYCVVDAPPAKRVACPPFSDYCDPVVTDAAQWRQMLGALATEACTIKVRCLHNEIPIVSGELAVVHQDAWHGLDLTPPVDELWNSLHSSARRAIRKARHEGVVVRRARDVSELRAFFELHIKVRKYKYRLLAQPYAFFEHLWSGFVEQGKGSLELALHDDRIVGGVFFLEWQDRIYYKFNASDVAAASVRPNDLVLWSAIESAKARGMRRLDLGLSGHDQEGLVRYKRKYASEEKTITHLQRELPPADPGAAAQVRAALPVLTDLLTREDVPDSVTECAGDLLYKFFA